MIYRERAVTEIDVRFNFRAYRVVRLLHDLSVIGDMELIRHEEHIFSTLPAAVHVDWERYRLFTGPKNEFLQL